MLVVQFRSSVITCAFVRSCGAAYWTVGTSRWMAARSSQVIVGIEPKPPWAPPDVVVPDMTMSRFDPIAAYDCSTIAFAPSPIATIAITAATPMMIPSAVRNDRSLLRISALPAIRIVCSAGHGRRSRACACSCARCATASASAWRASCGFCVRSD